MHLPFGIPGPHAATYLFAAFRRSSRTSRNKRHTFHIHTRYTTLSLANQSALRRQEWAKNRKQQVLLLHLSTLTLLPLVVDSMYRESSYGCKTSTSAYTSPVVERQEAATPRVPLPADCQDLTIPARDHSFVPSSFLSPSLGSALTNSSDNAGHLEKLRSQVVRAIHSLLYPTKVSPHETRFIKPQQQAVLLAQRMVELDIQFGLPPLQTITPIIIDQLIDAHIKSVATTADAFPRGTREQKRNLSKGDPRLDSEKAALDAPPPTQSLTELLKLLWEFAAPLPEITCKRVLSCGSALQDLHLAVLGWLFSLQSSLLSPAFIARSKYDGIMTDLYNHCHALTTCLSAKFPNQGHSITAAEQSYVAAVAGFTALMQSKQDINLMHASLYAPILEMMLFLPVPPFQPRKKLGNDQLAKDPVPEKVLESMPAKGVGRKKSLTQDESNGQFDMVPSIDRPSVSDEELAGHSTAPAPLVQPSASEKNVESGRTKDRWLQKLKRDMEVALLIERASQNKSSNMNVRRYVSPAGLSDAIDCHSKMFTGSHEFLIGLIETLLNDAQASLIPASRSMRGVPPELRQYKIHYCTSKAKWMTKIFRGDRTSKTSPNLIPKTISDRIAQDLDCLRILLRYAYRHLRNPFIAEQIFLTVIEPKLRELHTSSKLSEHKIEYYRSELDNIRCRGAALLRDNEVAEQVTKAVLQRAEARHNAKRGFPLSADPGMWEPEILFVAGDVSNSTISSILSFWVSVGKTVYLRYWIHRFLTFRRELYKIRSESNLPEKVVQHTTQLPHPRDKISSEERLARWLSNPEIIVVLLNAARKCGNVSLTERIWQVAAEEEEIRGWKLTVQAYTIMLQLYGDEKRREIGAIKKRRREFAGHDNNMRTPSFRKDR